MTDAPGARWGFESLRVGDTVLIHYPEEWIASAYEKGVVERKTDSYVWVRALGSPNRRRFTRGLVLHGASKREEYRPRLGPTEPWETHR